MLSEYSFEDIYIRHAVDECPNDKNFPMHIHERCEIYFFVSGDVDYLVEGSKYPLEKNSLMIMRPGETHKAKILGAGWYERFAVNFPLSFANKIDPECILLKAFTERPLGKNNYYSPEEIDGNLIHKLFEEMCENTKTDYEKKLNVTTHIYMLLNRISRAFAEKKTDDFSPKSLSEKFIIYIEKHMADELSVPKLAKQFHLSTSQFCRIFKQTTGAAPWEYIIKKRLTAANERIKSGESAQKACEHCGFNDYSAFYRAYNKHFGYSPNKTSSV